ncbi:UDP-Glycosyltransferase/glycogen phosphorylase [Thozetella sp. PMI_491]|nr:UDP-Glycosyltransferase/glycogen phosphorylase [Thozetella sp. PMI_491]
MKGNSTPSDASSYGGAEKPVVIVTALPCVGHTEPLIQVTQHLVLHGFEVHFLAGPAFRKRIEDLGANWYNNPRVMPDAVRDAIARTPAGWMRLYRHLLTSWVYGIRERHYRLRILLESVRELRPNREIVVITEPMCTGFLPFYFGAPLPHGFTTLPKVINIHVFPIWITSIDTAPFGLGWAPSQSKFGRLMNQIYRILAEPIYQVANRKTNKVYRSLGATRKLDEWILDAMMKNYDVTLTPTVPSLEYPRSDLPDNIRFIGCWPSKEVCPDYQFPPWWTLIADNRRLPEGDPEKKKLAVVCQGTIAIEYKNLIIPAIGAMGARRDVLLVAILGIKGAMLPPTLEPPANVFVVDYMPYDAIFPLCDFIICNAGWGGFNYAVGQGVPMIAAGVTEDKKEVAMRGERAGNAINLRTETPSIAKLGKSIDLILSDSSYKQRARELKQESDKLDPLGPLGRVGATVMELAALSNTIPKTTAGDRPKGAMSEKSVANDVGRGRRSSERTVVTTPGF